MYVDGIAGNTISDAEWHHVVITDTTGVNASAVTIGSAAGGYFEGSLDEVRLYTVALSANEVAGLFQVGNVMINGAL